VHADGTAAVHPTPATWGVSPGRATGEVWHTLCAGEPLPAVVVGESREFEGPVPGCRTGAESQPRSGDRRRDGDRPSANRAAANNPLLCRYVAAA
jgi:hypothetical protein